MRRHWAWTWWRGQPWLGPEVLAAGLIFALLCVCAVGRDFGWVLIAIPAVPTLFILMLACMGWSTAHRVGGLSMPLAMVIIAASVPGSMVVQKVWDWTGVTLWSLWHRDAVATAAGRDAILTGWGEWGWVGGSTFAYVAADAQDALGQAAGAERWQQRLRLDCPVTYAQRIRAHLYLVETSDCPFDGAALP